MRLTRRARGPADQALPAAGPSPAEQAGVFLGTLRSEVDEPDELAESFTHMQVVTDGILSAYRRGQLSAVEAGERLALLRLRDRDGVHWTLGSTSMRWYRRLPGGRWKVATPPAQEDGPLARSADAAIEALVSLGGPGARSVEPISRPPKDLGPELGSEHVSPDLASVMQALDQADLDRAANPDPVLPAQADADAELATVPVPAPWRARGLGADDVWGDVPAGWAGGAPSVGDDPERVSQPVVAPWDLPPTAVAAAGAVPQVLPTAPPAPEPDAATEPGVLDDDVLAILAALTAGRGSQLPDA